MFSGSDEQSTINTETWGHAQIILLERDTLWKGNSKNWYHDNSKHLNNLPRSVSLSSYSQYNEESNSFLHHLSEMAFFVLLLLHVCKDGLWFLKHTTENNFIYLQNRLSISLLWAQVSFKTCVTAKSCLHKVIQTLEFPAFPSAWLSDTQTF